ncbi:unnamed protein product [Pleuronectes platessa]|uniref:Uncharacterized protein n=1 Tax=Pleuronectes platessa TaxID=8262 RepID=A0A9N7VSE1_PLEPL|nr:unnamed protein product [Pleuronectes platessa]
MCSLMETLPEQQQQQQWCSRFMVTCQTLPVISFCIRIRPSVEPAGGPAWNILLSNIRVSDLLSSRQAPEGRLSRGRSVSRPFYFSDVAFQLLCSVAGAAFG